MRARMTSGAAGGLFIALSSFQFGGVVILGVTATDQGLSVPVMLAVRFAIAAVLLAAALALSGRPLRAARGEGRRLVALGAFGYALEAALFFLAIERGTATAVTLLFFTYPVVVTTISVVLRIDRPAPLMLGALAAAVGGSALIVSSPGDLGIGASGVALALGAATTFAIYLVGAERTLIRTSSLTGAMWVSASASAGLAASALVRGGRLPSGGVEWWSVVGMGAFTAGAFVCLFAGLRLLGAVRTSIVAALEPLSTAVLAAIFLSERVRGIAILGGVLILAGATAASVARGERAAPEPEIP